ncbi:MAG: shikimate dehydrogenase, partial [Mangrovicoccus sp.]|nr:shikimate dehydrogenase [Mangrovicoccus sp.]
RQSLPDWDAAAGPAAVFGAGGAARAVIDALLDAGVPELRLANRSRDKAEELADLFGPRVVVVDWAAAETMVDGAATLVNTTSLGMTGQPPFTLSLAGLSPGAVASDLVYVPLETPFLIKAARHGARTVDGLGMLLHQAVPAFARWFGRPPRVTDELRAAMLAP